MAGNEVTLTFAGDAAKLDQAANKAVKSTESVGDAASKAGKQMDDGGKNTDAYTGRVAKMSIITTHASDQIQQIGGTIEQLADIQNQAKERASAHARALLDVQQAGLDAKQAVRDLSQATLDLGQAQVDIDQANLDAKVAQEAYTQAVKEHGVNSNEARQAAIDLTQAQQDLKQANEDASQAQQDQSQAAQDGKQAQQDLKDAMFESSQTAKGWHSDLQTATAIAAAIPGVIGLATAAQWAWNIAMDANPIGLVVLAIAALVAAVVWIATKTDWFQRAWRASWGFIKSAAEDVWNWLKQVPDWIGAAFGKVAGYISAPYRAAFNLISDAWNNTIGRLHWSVPDWVPGIGGNSISAPHLPHFHSGGLVPGVPGQEVLAVLQAGEKVLPTGQGNSSTVQLVVAPGADNALATFLHALARQGILQFEVAA